MSKAVQRRRGTTAEHTTFTGALAELTVDTTKDTVVVHDGAAAGGYPLAREDLNNVSEIPVSKLADGAARQLLQTAANGTDVEWTNNVDVPGTLDVTGLATFDNNVTIAGDLTVNGATTTINSTIVTIDDKLIELGSTATPTDAGADQGGIVLKGTTDKSFKWVDATDAWTSSEHIDLASGKAFYINGTQVLSGTALGSGVLITSTNITNGTIVNDDINASAGIVDTKLATISTTGKVSNSATTATNANTPSTIVARDGSGNFTAGTITAALTGAASSNVLKAGDTMTGVLAVTAGTAALPSVAISGDTNTGLYSPGADQAAITTGGTQKFTIDSLDGNAIIENSFPTIRPSLDLAFALTKTLDPRITFTRSSDGTYTDANGVLRTATSNTARFDHNPTTGESLGLLVEEQRTNSIRNNTMVGAVAGTPGTLPTNWGVYTALTGITREIVGTGTESGITYIDIRLSGTPSATGTYAFYTETNSAVAALSGQTWTNSQYIKLQAGSLTGVSSTRLYFQENNSSGGYLTEQNITVFGPTSSGLSTQRVSATRTLNQASTAYVQSGFNFTLTGVAIDITLRIGLPQLEQGAFATSVIPTSTAAVTRSADVASITGTAFSSWYRQDEGTVFAEGTTVLPSSGITHRPLCYFGNSGATDRWEQRYMSIAVGSRTYVNDDGVAQADFSFDTPAAGQTIKSSSAIALNNFAACVNASNVQTDTSGTVPTVDRLEIGTSVNQANSLNGTIRRLTYWPARLPNATLQALTK